VASFIAGNGRCNRGGLAKAETVNQLENRVRAITKPVLERFLSRAGKWVSDVSSSVEEGRSALFPLSLFGLLTRPGVDDPVVIQISISDGARRFLIAEVSTEEGRILSPSLERALPHDPSRPEWDQASEQFAGQLEVFLEQALPTILEALGASDILDILSRVPRARDEIRMSRDAFIRMPDLEREPREAFTERAREQMSGALGTDLAPASLELPSGESQDFDLASADKSIVGKVRRDQSGRVHISTITDLIWQLQRPTFPSRRVLVMGPKRNSLDRWIARYGSVGLPEVELWWLDSAQPSRLA
jgi:hypothetical protein